MHHPYLDHPTTCSTEMTIIFPGQKHHWLDQRDDTNSQVASLCFYSLKWLLSKPVETLLQLKLYQTWKDMKTRFVHCQTQNCHSEFSKERRNNAAYVIIKIKATFSCFNPKSTCNHPLSAIINPSNQWKHDSSSCAIQWPTKSQVFDYSACFLIKSPNVARANSSWSSK